MLIHGDTTDLFPAGFDQQVREAMDQHRKHHVAEGKAISSRDGVFNGRNLPDLEW